jgi:hypothetical protein
VLVWALGAAGCASLSGWEVASTDAPADGPVTVRLASPTEAAAEPLPPLPGEPQAAAVTPPAPVTSRPTTGPSPSAAAVPLERLVADEPQPKAAVDGQVGTVACASCGASYLPDLAPAGCPSCGGSGTCVPGRKPCYSWEAQTFVGRFFGNLYDCLCCPDPCYQPSWVPEQNAGFFPDYPRPQTMSRLRWDYGRNMMFPDRNEYFWARSNVALSTWQANLPHVTVPGGLPTPLVLPPNLAKLATTKTAPKKLPNGLPTNAGRGPKTPVVSLATRHHGRLVYQPWGERQLQWDQLYLYTEAATQRAGFFFEYPYRSVSALYDGHFAGFSDLRLGTRAVLLDCELMLATFQFKTYLPTGSSSKGLGTGHVSLEPSLIVAIRLGAETYVEGQLAEWIPIGGDTTYAGALLDFRTSLNHVLYRITPDVPIIGTLEMSGWAFQDGAYTNPFLGPQPSHHSAYVNLGPGLRMSVCKRIDFGTNVSFPVEGDGHWASTWVRSEFRILY